mmetsp:Transcript_27816/g.89517  ORF Transcript_27816/g.89517 Transcript_27816/m.89517 type:complete len:90 (+) Transcript_27816:79-348(+)
MSLSKWRSPVLILKALIAKIFAWTRFTTSAILPTSLACDLVRERRTVEHGLDVECFCRDVFHFVPNLFLFVQIPERIVIHERQLLHDST